MSKRAKYQKFVLYISFLEIYLDQVRDLGRYYVLSKEREVTAQTGSKKVHDDDYATQNLEIHEGPDGKVYVKALTSIPITTVDEAMAVIRAGFDKRATFETAMNPVSSRSHTVFSLTIASTDAKSGDSVTGTLNLVDLAGSERLNKSQSQGPRLEEAKHISKSLSALANVVVALQEGAAHIPYRY